MKRLLACAILAAVPVAVLAHHGWSEYDSSRALKLTGKIIESGYEHPTDMCAWKRRARLGT